MYGILETSEVILEALVVTKTDRIFRRTSAFSKFRKTESHVERWYLRFQV